MNCAPKDMTVSVVKYLICSFHSISHLGQWEIVIAQFSQSSRESRGLNYWSVTGDTVVSLCSCPFLFLSAPTNWCLTSHTYALGLPNCLP